MEETNPNNSHHFNNANIERNSFPASFGLLRSDLRMATAAFVLELVALTDSEEALQSSEQGGSKVKFSYSCG